MMRTNIGNVPLEKELLKERNWSKHLEYTENLWRKDIQGLNSIEPILRYFNMSSDLQKIRMCFILLPACLLFISLIYEWYNRISF